MSGATRTFYLDDEWIQPADEVMEYGLFAALRNVRFWHKADIQASSGNVRFWGKADVRNLSGGNRCGSLGLLAHCVATPPDRLDVVFAARCTSEFFSQLADKDVDDLHLWLVHTAIEIAQEHFLSQRRSLAQRQEFQHLVLFAVIKIEKRNHTQFNLDAVADWSRYTARSVGALQHPD